MLISESHQRPLLVTSLREKDNRMEKIESENFDLKLERWTRKRKASRHRDSSSSLLPDSFYDESSDGSRNSNAYTDIMDPDKKIEILKGELNEARDNYEKLLLEVNQIRQENDELAIKAEQKGRDYASLSSDFQKKANELQQRKDEYNKKVSVLRTDLQALRSKANEIKRVAEEERREKEEANRRYEVSQKQINEIQIKSDGLQMEKEVIQAALTEAESSLWKERERAKTKEDALLRAEQLEHETKQIAIKERALREEAEVLVSQKAAELESALRKANQYLNDRGAISAALKTELQNADTWEKADRLMGDGKKFFAADSEHYRELQRTIEDGESKFADITTYNPKWREDVAGHLNACLKMLCLMEAETQARRMYVLQCGSSTTVQEPNVEVA
ncbi:Reticulocyte-binding protein 2 a [Gracilaria domingensis]|nr:Reticulocyte-binding protein 2 a [Gracilaria domingensis]